MSRVDQIILLTQLFLIGSINGRFCYILNAAKIVSAYSTFYLKLIKPFPKCFLKKNQTIYIN